MKTVVPKLKTMGIDQAGTMTETPECLLINSTFLSSREKEKLQKPTNVNSVMIAIITMTISLFVKAT